MGPTNTNPSSGREEDLNYKGRQFNADVRFISFLFSFFRYSRSKGTQSNHKLSAFGTSSTGIRWIL